MKVAYVTPESCGTGHAMRGVALLRAARRSGIELRAFGPGPMTLWDPAYPTRDIDCSQLVADGYEASEDWYKAIVRYRPDLIIGDLAWHRLDPLHRRG